MEASPPNTIIRSSPILSSSNIISQSTWQPIRERRRLESSRLIDDDDCDVLGAYLIEDTNQSNSINSHENLEEGIREARRVNNDLTTQRNVVLEFLLRSLQTAQTELSIEVGTHSSQMPRIRLHLSRLSPVLRSPRAIESEHTNRLEQPNSYHLSMLSRLNGLSQRTREVMQDIDRRRNAAGLTSLHLPKDLNEVIKPTNDQPDETYQMIKPFPRRKIQLEERLLIQWSPSNLDLHGIKLPSLYEIPRKVFRNPDSQSISR
ncbi:uncharacterized protein MELLADRAFT_116114 [Melampsora larici-populina 98AG31]|uniref:Uncharacterized protein n=1 Tax=Melampsora larici-populina (strain 98AG31 / pathotype 3-4-7) TaxID=747676 RepID=F4RHV3_MELLP|nr:uncharacterized protein MELLADRAFT_116114 [Melampsora larici-populina 98AG31]EGG07889.1 hypothetical protein MELLADRAFT_116114 [Melampsora larici-populina 98AG31]